MCISYIYKMRTSIQFLTKGEMLFYHALTKESPHNFSMKRSATPLYVCWLSTVRYGYINKSILEEILLIVLICNAVTGSILNSTLDKRKILD